MWKRGRVGKWGFWVLLSTGSSVLGNYQRYRRWRSTSGLVWHLSTLTSSYSVVLCNRVEFVCIKWLFPNGERWSLHFMHCRLLVPSGRCIIRTAVLTASMSFWNSPQTVMRPVRYWVKCCVLGGEGRVGRLTWMFSQTLSAPHVKQVLKISRAEGYE